MSSKLTTLRHLTRHLMNHRTPTVTTTTTPPHQHHLLTRLSAMSTSTRRNPTKKVDIGAKARQMQNRRLWRYALSFSGVGVFFVLVINNFQDQLVFYVTPTDALEKYRANPDRSKYRLGGLVLEGSVSQSNADTEFVVTDLVTDILVRFQGSLPDLFREGHSVVVEGFVTPFTDEIKSSGMSEKSKQITVKARSEDCFFKASEVLAKHDEKYMPGEVAAAIEKNKKKLAEDAEAAGIEKNKKLNEEIEAAAEAKKAAAA